MSALIEQLVRVKLLRRSRALAKALVDVPKKALEEQLKDKVAELRELDTTLSAEEATRRALVLDAFAKNPDEKKPAPGVAVQVKEVLEYDEAAAFEWAKATGMALIPQSLDRSAFEKIAKVTDLPFVVKKEVPAATIATDLDKVDLPELAAINVMDAPEMGND